MTSDSDIIYSDDGNVIVYQTRKGRVIGTVSHESMYQAGFVAREWHRGQFSALYKLGNGDFTFETVCDASAELSQAFNRRIQSICRTGNTVDAGSFDDVEEVLRTLSRVLDFAP